MASSRPAPVRLSGLRLRTRLLVLVTAGAVVPLSLIGLWLVNSSTRAGTELLRSRLEETVAAEADALLRQWTTVRSDLLLLADNDEAWRQLAPYSAGADARPDGDPAALRFLTEAFGTAHRAIARVEFFDAAGTARMALPGARSIVDSTQASASTPGEFVVQLPVLDNNGAQVGHMAATVRLPLLLPSAAEGSAAGAVLGVRDTRTGAAVVNPNLPVDAAARSRFEIEGDSWIAATRALQDPPLALTAGAAIEPAITPFRRAARTGSTALLAVACLALVVTGSLTTRLTRTISQMAAAAQAIAAGDLEHRIDVSRSDEIGKLGQALNDTAASLRSTLDALTRQRALAAIGEFATSLAHEVRNAHTAISVDLQRLSTHVSEPDAQEMLRRSQHRLGAVEGIVDGALRIARSGKIEATDTDLTAILDASAHAVQPWFAEKGCALTVRCAVPGRLPIRGDEVALQTAFVSLLRNAAQALRAGGRAYVDVAREGNGYCIVIRDDGIGMSATHVEAAFTPFFTTRDDGTGLGLPIARQVVYAHGGSIDLQSALDAGTTVTVRLPAGRI